MARSGTVRVAGRVIFLFTFSCSYLPVHPDDSGLQHRSKLVSQRRLTRPRHQSWLFHLTTLDQPRPQFPRLGNEQSKLGSRFSEAEGDGVC